MCGRISLSYHDARLLAEELGVPVESLPPTYQPRYNVAPTQPHPIVRMRHEERELLIAKWGLVNSWAKDAKQAYKTINARAEGIDKRPAFRQAFQKRRCLVPADGFFEWTGPKGRRQPFWFHRRDGKLLLLAGLYESWQPQPGEWERTFTIVTTGANEPMRAFHDRMPVVLAPDVADRWLDPAEDDLGLLKRMLVPPPEAALIWRAVSPRVNSADEDEPSLLEEVPAQRPLI